jgi:hypothetical protein
MLYSNAESEGFGDGHSTYYLQYMDQQLDVTYCSLSHIQILNGRLNSPRRCVVQNWLQIINATDGTVLRTSKGLCHCHSSLFVIPYIMCSIWPSVLTVGYSELVNPVYDPVSKNIIAAWFGVGENAVGFISPLRCIFHEHLCIYFGLLPKLLSFDDRL